MGEMDAERNYRKIPVLLESDQSSGQRQDTLDALKTINGVFNVVAAFPGHELPPEKDVYYVVLRDEAQPETVRDDCRRVGGVKDAPCP